MNLLSRKKLIVYFVLNQLVWAKSCSYLLFRFEKMHISAQFLGNIIAENDIELSDFDRIALKDLGIIVREEESDAS